MCGPAGDGELAWNSNPSSSLIISLFYLLSSLVSYLSLIFTTSLWVIVAGSGVSTFGVLLSSVGIGPGGFPGMTFSSSMRLLTPRFFCLDPLLEFSFLHLLLLVFPLLEFPLGRPPLGFPFPVGRRYIC